MQRGRSGGSVRRVALIGTSFAAAAGLAALGLERIASPVPEISPAQAVAQRFAAEGPAATGGARPEQLAARGLERTTAARLALSPNSLLRAELPEAAVTGGVPEQATLYAPAATDGGIRLSIVSDGISTGSVPGNPDAPRHGNKPSPVNRNAAFSDGQIVSIKQRLKLTPDQAPYWPAVESALRELVWRHARDRRAEHATLDPDGVRKLAAAAVALMPHLTAEQKHEVRTLAFLLGLDKLASQF